MVLGHWNVKNLWLTFVPLLHSVISPQNFGEKTGFCQRFCLGGPHFEMPGEKYSASFEKCNYDPESRFWGETQNF